MSLLIFNDNGVAVVDRLSWLLLGMVIYMFVDSIRKPNRDNISGTLLAGSINSLMWWYLISVCWNADGHLTEKFGENFTILAKGFPWTVPPLLLVAAIVVSKMRPRRPTTVQVEPPAESPP